MHVSIRPRSDTDRDRVLAWRNHEDIRRWMFSDHVIEPAEHEAWFVRSAADESRIDWIVEVDSEPSGAAALFSIDRRNRRALWEIYLAPDAPKGHSIGTAVQLMVVGFGFERLHLHRIACEALATNDAALALYAGFGFQVDGSLRDFVWRDHRWVDAVVLSLLEDDWGSAKDQALRRLEESSISTPDVAGLQPAEDSE